jgi:hypothetical protein
MQAHPQETAEAAGQGGLLTSLEAALRNALRYVDSLLVVYDAAAEVVEGTDGGPDRLRDAVDAAWQTEAAGESALRALRVAAGDAALVDDRSGTAEPYVAFDQVRRSLAAPEERR